MKIPVSKPAISDLERQYVLNALESNAISGIYGDYIERFENEFASFCGAKYAVSCSNGTTALHLALVAAGIKEGDEVLVSTLTNMASFFAVLYIKAIPIPVDIDPETLTMDPIDLLAKLTVKSKAIMVVHLFGHPTDMDPVNDIAKGHGLIVVEDCAEAHGATYKGRKVGSLGNVGCFSFFANKILTTGEGGMITTDDLVLAKKAKSLKSLAFGVQNKFMHEDVGYNYRLTNIQAAIGCGQMARANALVEKRREIANYYSEQLGDYKAYLSLPIEKSYAKSSYWMFHIVLREPLETRRSEIMTKLKECGVETREGFIPFNLQKIFINQGLASPKDCPIANKFAYSSFYLPTGPDISYEELEYVVAKTKLAVESVL
jgi:perosamine synthetase